MTVDPDMVSAYLSRIGLAEKAGGLMGRAPNCDDLKTLLQSHLTAVPFENLGQHTHAADEGVDQVVRGPHVPSLDVSKTLKKIVLDKRGGFCWEINAGFAWLLRSLGYKVRFGNSNVIMPGGPIPGHLCIFVDGLGPDPIHVDPGFGDAPREPMPLKFDNPVTDTMVGDTYSFQPNSDPKAFEQSPEQAARFSAVLTRSRNVGMGGSPMVDLIGIEKFGGATPEPTAEMTPPESIYLLEFRDDLELECKEFQHGLASVLSAESLFSQKRMCIILRDTGFDFVGDGYWKQVRQGKEISRTTLEGEAAYRAALLKVSGITL
eukprot:Hpha_TRINITY_DN3157_c0_g1::TRINITY_DN3157_c0_g1_i1::g.96475::m.96475/K00675/nhoA; N-hydroxyarylamine O-acetyltransferase